MKQKFSKNQKIPLPLPVPCFSKLLSSLGSRWGLGLSLVPHFCISPSVPARSSKRDVVYLGWLIAPSYMSPNEGGGGESRGLSLWVQLYIGAQINFRDLTPYSTYGPIKGARGEWPTMVVLAHEFFFLAVFIGRKWEGQKKPLSTRQC